MSEPPYTVALSGGIASGKSSVSDRLAMLGACVVDTDLLAREVVAPGSSGLSELVASFGESILLPDGSLDRRTLRQRVFADSQARARVEAITHPRIREAATRALQACQGPYALLVVPLLYENRQAYGWVDRVAVVDVARETQLQRLLARDGITAELAESMLDAQASREQRLSMADDVIDNEGDLAALDAAVTALHQRYVQLAGQSAG